MFYLDASSCVAALTPESGTDRITTWLEAHLQAPLATSPWVAVEVASAFSLKVRGGALTPDQRAAAMLAWAGLERSLRTLSVSTAAFASAAEMLSRAELGLRSGDALHVAVAALHDCSLVTLDQRLARAAPQLGVGVVEL